MLREGEDGAHRGPGGWASGGKGKWKRRPVDRARPWEVVPLESQHHNLLLGSEYC